MASILNLTGKERTFAEHEVIVSKTNEKGIITYANETFLAIADYKLAEVIGKPHNLIRNPNMPRSVFKLLWERIRAKKEIFAYVVNSTKQGDYYWVFAHVTPTFDNGGNIIGYHSNRRSPKKESVKIISSIYKQLLDEEAKHETSKKATDAGYALLQDTITKKGISYDELILSI